MSGSYYDGTTWYIDNIPQHSEKHVFAGLDGDINTNSWSDEFGYRISSSNRTNPIQIRTSWTCLFCGCRNVDIGEGSGCCGQGKAWGCGAPRNLSVVERSR